MKITKLLAMLMVVAMVCGMFAVAASAESDVTLPREETLYFGGQQWGTVNSWNPIGANQNNAMAFAAKAGGSRCIMFETLYMYNTLNGDMVPFLADGDAEWNEDLTECVIKINPAAKWSDGTPVTANDVKATWDIGVEINNGAAGTYKSYIAGFEVIDDLTVKMIAVVNDEGKPTNPLIMKDYLTGTYVAQAAWIEALKAECNGDAAAILNASCKNEDGTVTVPYSGAYGYYYDDDQKVVFVRNEEYWGQDESMWGKLPAPKYIAHAMYADNAASEVAFKDGQIDVNQQFIPNIQNLWLEDDLPISTYMDEAPYGVCLTIPTAWYNMNIPVIAENPALRKAIAMAVDYDSIIANAMTNQSPSFDAVPRSVMNPTDGEQALYNHEAVADLQWVGMQYDEAIAMLDEAGLVDTDGNGWREWNGEEIVLNACCPNGWSDWQAAMEIVAAAGEKIGINISTNYPEWSIYQTVFTAPGETEYCIFMYSCPAAQPSNPWGRVNAFFNKDFIGMENNWSGNYGQYSNDEADAIVKAIPLMTDAEEIKEAYTKLTEIYLTEVPSFSLMYRPDTFHAVNESVWTNYPSADDGLNIPPADCTDGYGIAALYNLELVG